MNNDGDDDDDEDEDDNEDDRFRLYCSGDDDRFLYCKILEIIMNMKSFLKNVSQ